MAVDTNKQMARTQTRDQKDREFVKARIVALAEAVKRTRESKRFWDIVDSSQSTELERIERELRALA